MSEIWEISHHFNINVRLLICSEMNPFLKRMTLSVKWSYYHVPYYNNAQCPCCNQSWTSHLQYYYIFFHLCSKCSRQLNRCFYLHFSMRRGKFKNPQWGTESFRGIYSSVYFVQKAYMAQKNAKKDFHQS